MKQLSILVLGFVVAFIVFFATYPGCYARARMLELMGVTDAARSTYDKITERAPDTSWADRSEERLAFLEAASLPESSVDSPATEAKPEPTPKPSFAEQAVAPIEEAQRLQQPQTAPQDRETPKKETHQEKRIEPSYGGPLGAYHHSKNKINDIQQKHNKELMRQMQD